MTYIIQKLFELNTILDLENKIFLFCINTFH